MMEDKNMKKLAYIVPRIESCHASSDVLLAGSTFTGNVNDETVIGNGGNDDDGHAADSKGTGFHGIWDDEY